MYGKCSNIIPKVQFILKVFFLAVFSYKYFEKRMIKEVTL